MKIGIDVRLWNETGVGRYIRNLITQLVLLDTKNIYVLFARKEDVDTLKSIAPSSWKIVSVSIHWHSLSEQFSFLPILYKEQLDLMHFPYFSLPVLYRRPFVVTIHDLIIHSFATGKASTLPLPLYKMKLFGYKKVIEQATKQAKKVIVPLQAVKDEVEKTFTIPGENVIVTYEGFDSQIGDITEQNGNEINGFRIKDHPYFLYVGNSYPHKNVEKLIEGFLRFRNQSENNEYSLVLVGKEDYFSKRIKLLYKNNKNIIFLHNVSDSMLGYLYNHAIALVSASLMEGFGLPCLEAAACECLVAVSDIPSFREVCKGNALYFNPHSVEDISNIFPQILSLSEDQRIALIRNGKQRAQSFSWKQMTEETITIYESCLSIRSDK